MISFLNQVFISSILNISNICEFSFFMWCRFVFFQSNFRILHRRRFVFVLIINIIATMSCHINVVIVINIINFFYHYYCYYYYYHYYCYYYRYHYYHYHHNCYHISIIIITIIIRNWSIDPCWIEWNKSG